jgi:hypothetical protein
MLVSLIFGVATFFAYGIGDLILSILQLMFLALWLMRAFSRNFYKRRAENTVFLRIWGRVKPFFGPVKNFFMRLADRKHRYFKCTVCKARLRVPRGRGKITITCPRCRNRFDKKS